ncbi:MAG: hypothetical protein COW01_04675 [Bdellovibrionales bacterium CG12_big_fil_rev_8_21_14_0_65_38_15]|nr:MAG: hypothetical protein COW79_11995 [Bdellovibrionales bacterium CG22_combo_CG10-13_8_21_14_all_38_13]PIQ56352.1 MAG: hypothetical protein COW01_04675 [Bdellovibrionales bacterium CG12_big_fil_rev_8_21_14_0_65_38_15]PIR29383.1 MAG: hypothetical protein COV38_11610 [Bdellovibrionales bacterium CG11_big_fil_rev_8_21_14_0_20_38_13]
MKAISKQFKEDIKSLIAEYETKTSAQIVPVLLNSSDSYPSAHFRWALILSLCFPVILYISPLTSNDPIEFLVAQGIGVIAGFIIAFYSKAKRLFLTKKQMNEEVYQRAIQAFHEHNLTQTPQRNAVLIFISFFERRIHIIADSGALEKISNKKWEDLIKGQLGSLKKGQYEESLMELIHGTGRLLTEHFKQVTNKYEDNVESGLDDELRTD